MKIGIDIRPLQEENISGVGEYLFYLLKYLAKNETKNKYVLLANSFHEPKIPKFIENSNKFELKKYRIPNKIFNLCQVIFKYPKLDKLLGGVDILFLPNITFTSVSSNCKLILTVHDLSYLQYKEYLSWKRKIWHKIVNPKSLIKRADKIIAVSESTKRELEDLLNVSQDKIDVIYSGISYKDNKKEINTKSKYSTGNKYILALGVLEPRKNIYGLIKAFSELNEKYSNYKLVIVGKMGWKNKMLSTLNNKNIIYTGYVTEAEKNDLFSKAEVFIYPSFYEGFGFPPIEALLHNKKVITSNTTSFPEIVGQFVTMVDPNNKNDIKQALEININKNQEIKPEIIVDLKEKLDWQKTAQKVENLFIKIKNRFDQIAKST
ncbi:MAG: glycosyltransferase family 1 protein [bacterium]